MNGLHRFKALGVAVALMGAGCLSVDGAIFLPLRTSHYALPGNVVPDALLEEVSIPVQDDVVLAAVWAHQPGPGPTVLLLHGQGGNLDDVWPRAIHLWNAGYSVLALDYRGYGRSTGRPSEEGLYADAEAARDFLAGRPEVDVGRLLIWGHSLGTGVASGMGHEGLAGMVLESAFTRMADMVEHSAPLAFPAEWLVKSRFDTEARIGDLRLPLLVAHGSADARTPLWMGQRVFAAAEEPKALSIVPGAGHSDTVERGLPQLLEALRQVAPALVP